MKMHRTDFSITSRHSELKAFDQVPNFIGIELVNLYKIFIGKNVTETDIRSKIF